MRYYDPHALQIFITVCEEGSITGAAERIAIVPSAVSKRLSALEEQVGVKLLERSKRGAVPTPAGEVLLRSAKETLVALERMHAELSEFSDGVQGNLRILASLSVICQFLPKQISTFMQAHEKVRITLEEKVSSLITRGIEEGRGDIGICWADAHTKNLYSQPYLTDQLAIVVNAQHPLADKPSLFFEDTLPYDHVEILPGSLVSLTLQREASALGSPIRFRIHVTTFDAACRIVDSNIAIAVVPLEVATLYETAMNIKAIPLNDSWATRTFVACVRDYAKLSVPARALFDHLTNTN
ncbi:LysR family transcriptional regulator [Halomonas sp. ISL-60]|uniref:LysR family transcriptional regulator n=1 Tax=unclassified Halomonas TaxID=2609666 RepID=UPI0007DA1EB5|nr:LysR family transcriptional regulator [Halomonas sp. ALS9]MBT2774763.1 LysR family transcriptional regulator [Halomonas sp. ISL-60]MBT2786444.1 LysR family transcriptional regulator [Halomonas sp. ISL-106]MBT2797466.1 LysR family transcriptional regulator [Halomonas sp. ISL-104]MBT2802971.1 LysR family transcriptional regulator [Halomonas sp. ISL-56]OAL58828.1 hypothetical protein A6R74_08055 [Halomonas sp. ALS9]